MQLLFDRSEEGGGAGLGVIEGRVRRLVANRVPQMGWNAIEDITDPMLVASGVAAAYFANSYVCEPASAELTTAWATHESDRFAVAVRSGNTVGLQFHPEKSSAAGLRIIDRFLNEARR
jgi:glutamine amidotransferase